MECASPQDLLSNPHSFFNAMISAQSVKTPSPWPSYWINLPVTQLTEIKEKSFLFCDGELKGKKNYFQPDTEAIRHNFVIVI